MLYTAIVQSQSIEDSNQWLIAPQYTHVDGQPAENIYALAANGIVPAVNDLVLCAESRNSFDQSTFRCFDDNGGACPIIIATYSDLLTLMLDFVLKGKMTLGAGSNPMVLGNKLATWAQNVDAAIQALYTWAKTGTPPSGGPVDTGGIPPFPGTPAYNAWDGSELSQNHKLD